MNRRIMILSLSGMAVLLLLTPLCAQASPVDVNTINRASRGESANYVLSSAWVGEGGRVFSNPEPSPSASYGAAGGGYRLFSSLSQPACSSTRISSPGARYILQAGCPALWDRETPSFSVTPIVNTQGIFISYRVRDNMSSSAKIVVSDGVRESTPGEDGRGIIGPYDWRELFNIDLTATDEAGNRAKRKVYHFLEGSERVAILHHHLPDNILAVSNKFQKSEDNLSGYIIIANLILPGRIFKEGIPNRGPPVVEKVKEFQCLSGRKT